MMSTIQGQTTQNKNNRTWLDVIRRDPTALDPDQVMSLSVMGVFAVWIGKEKWDKKWKSKKWGAHLYSHVWKGSDYVSKRAWRINFVKYFSLSYSPPTNGHASVTYKKIALSPYQIGYSGLQNQIIYRYMHHRAVRLFMLSAPPMSHSSYAEGLVVRGVIRRWDRKGATFWPTMAPKSWRVVKREPNRWVSGTWIAEGPEQSTPQILPIWSVDDFCSLDKAF